MHIRAFIKPFEAPQRSVKIKIYLNFFTLPGIGTLRVKNHLNKIFFVFTKFSINFHEYIRMEKLGYKHENIDEKYFENMQNYNF